MNLNNRVSNAVSELQSIILAEKYLITINKKIQEQEEIVENLKSEVDEELRDVENLESKSRHSLFKNILGYDDSKLEIEKQEYLHAVLMLKDAVQSLIPLNFEKSILVEKVSKRKILEESLENLLILREKELLKSGEMNSSVLLNIYREIDALTKYDREIFEAKDIGLKCKRDVAEILAIFKKASKVRNWGYQVAMDPNIKSEKGLVDVAVSKFQELIVGLIKFEEELEDVHENGKIDIATNTIKFDLFTKYYNNYLINDWVIRERLIGVIGLISALMDDVVRLLRTLDQKKISNGKKMVEKEVQKMKIINSVK